MMNVREVAAYLNLKERKIYDLVRTGRIPCSRVTGKWLFPLDLIDRWVAEGVGAVAAPAPETSPPPVVAGSHDPLLEWALRESGCGLALMPGGSLAGLERLREGAAQVCGLHLFDSVRGTYNETAVADSLPGQGVVLIEWAWRNQGLALANGNPLGVRRLEDLRQGKIRIVRRQPEAGTHVLFNHLLSRAGVEPGGLNAVPQVARTQLEVGLAVLEEKADAGMCVEGVARQLRLDFLPLHRERYDLALNRRDYFGPPVQALLAFAKGPAFAARAAEMGGYDIEGLGTVHYNGP